MASWEHVKAAGLPMPRSGHAMAMNSSTNAIFVFGGVGSNKQGEAEMLNDMFQFNAATRSWRPVRQQGDIPSKREGATLTYVESLNLLLLFGGGDDEAEYNDTYTFDLSNATWKKRSCTGHPPSPRLNHTAAIIDGAIYIFGGFHDGVSVGDIVKLETDSFYWSSPSRGDAPPARCNHSCTAVGKKLFVFGGRAGENILFDDLQIYDTETNAWSTPHVRGKGAPTKRDFHTMVVAGPPSARTLCLFGGAHELESPRVSDIYNDVWLLDIDTVTWTHLQPKGGMPPTRWSHAAVSDATGSKMFVFGGTGAEAELNDLHVLDFGSRGATKPKLKLASGYGGSKKQPPPRPSNNLRKPRADDGSIQGPSVGEAPKPSEALITAAAAAEHPAVDPPSPAPAHAEVLDAQAKATGVPLPEVSYKTPTAIPSARPFVEPASTGIPTVRDFSFHEQEAVAAIGAIYDGLRSAHKKVDAVRAELEASRAALEAEKKTSEQTFQQQQRELAELKEKLKAETEAWLKEQQAKLEADHKTLQEEKEQFAKDKEQLEIDRQQLLKSQQEHTAREVVFEEKNKKMEALMAQFKGIAS